MNIVYRRKIKNRKKKKKSTFFEKLVNNRLVDYLEKFGLFSDFQ